MKRPEPQESYKWGSCRRSGRTAPFSCPRYGQAPIRHSSLSPEAVECQRGQDERRRKSRYFSPSCLLLFVKDFLIKFTISSYFKAKQGQEPVVRFLPLRYDVLFMRPALLAVLSLHPRKVLSYRQFLLANTFRLPTYDIRQLSLVPMQLGFSYLPLPYT